MQRHTKIYYKHFGYDISSWIPCEVCGTTSVDIHHIENKKSGGDPKGLKDKIENLMALCRTCHEKAHSSELKKSWLKEIHLKLL